MKTRDEALEILENTRMEFVTECRNQANRLISLNGQVTIDDVRELCPLPKGIDGRVYGAVFNTKDFKCVGYTTTKRKTSHRRPIGVFELSN